MPPSLRLAAASVLLGAVAAMPLSAAGPPARVLYTRTLNHEMALRPALGAAKVTPATLAEARRIIKAYERLASRYPGSGYTDNALLQAAKLAADVWAATGDDNDRTVAVGIYKRLVAGYPSSSLLSRARPELARLERATSPPSRSADIPEERVIPVPPPAAVRVRDVPPLPPPPAGPTTAAAGAEPATPATIRGITRMLLPGTVRVTIELDREVSYRDERIGSPDRVFLDLGGTQPGPAIRAKQAFSDGAVRQIRIGQRADNHTRVVLDVDRSVRHSVFALYDPYRLVIDCDVSAADATAARGSDADAAPPAVAEDRVRPKADTTTMAEDSVRLKADTTRVAEVPSTAAGAPAGDSAPIATAGASTPPATKTRPARKRSAAGRADAPLPTRSTAEITRHVTGAPTLSGTPSVTLDGRFSLSRQLGLSIARIVIDPGHGGHDPGARGKDLTEADLVLDVALRLEQLLLKQPGVEVMLTRRTDVFVPLEERTDIANREAADLFLSIHANASRSSKARGIETYFLNFASNPDAQAVAARENAASGRTMHSLPDIVKAITLNDKLDESRDFAAMVQRAMVERLRGSKHDVRDLGVKQAPFVVLIGAGMPSVLAEISFVTNPQEARLLKANAYRQRIAEALFDGIGRYQRAVKNVRTAANHD
jgi:N-acetylmuramoyl-L-alanine amidase